MKDLIPIISFGCGEEEITSAAGWAASCPNQFEFANEIKEKRIVRCYLIFYNRPETNEFLKSLKIVFKSNTGSAFSNIYLYKDALIALASIGAPAAAALMEELSVFGIKEFIAIGTAGCLDEKIKDKFLVVQKAIRDEGVSYHYLKPEPYVSTSSELDEEIENYLKEKNLDYVLGTTWTTDAIYRETTDKLKMAKDLGSVAVEMECAAWASVAKFRGFKFSQILYFSDVLSKTSWNILFKEETLSNSKDLPLLIAKDMIDK